MKIALMDYYLRRNKFSNRMELQVRSKLSVCFNILLAISGLLFCNIAIAEQKIILTDDIDRYEIGKHIQYLADPNNEFSITEILQKDDEFIDSEEKVPNFGYTDASYWIKVKYEYKTDLLLDKKRYAIEIFYPLLDNIEVYQKDRFGKYQVSRRGDSQPFYYRSPLYRNHIIKFDAVPNEPDAIYLKFKTQGSMRISLHLLSDDHLLEHISYVELLYGLGFGMLLMMVVYNLFLFFSLRESVYLNYVFYTLSFLILQLSLTGYAFEFLWPSSVWFANYSVSIWGAIFVFMSLLFLRSLLQTNINLPKIDKYLKIIVAIAAVNIAVSFIADYGTTIRFLSFISGILALILISTGIAGVYYKIRAAKYYVIGCVFLWIGIVIYVLMAKGLIPSNFWTENGILITAILELLIFSFALADRINYEREERERVQKESLEYLNDYVTVFENAEEGLFRLSLNGKFTNINTSLVKILGCSSKEEIVNSPINPMRRYFASLDAVKRFIRILRQNDKVVAFELEYKKPNCDAKGWASCSARLVRDQDNIPLYYEGSVLDITAKKEKEVTELKMEEVKANAEAKGVFLANMSHEIRTPMNSVLSFVELAQRLPEQSEKMKNYLGKIKLSSQSLLRIINDILDLSKIEAGKLKLEKINFDIASIVTNLREVFTDQAQKKGLEFIISVAENTPNKLIGDPVRLTQVLINLVSNAIKFTDKGSVTVEISHSFTSDQYVSLKFEITDTGVGINEEFLPTMFTPFNQQSDSVTRKYGGTGLGLSICAHLVSLMRGKIFVESEVGRGSCFTFTASFKGKTAPVTTDHIKEVVEHKPQPADVKDSLAKSVLVVEDNYMNQEVLKELLIDFNVDIYIAENGLEGVEAVKEQNFDVVFMDIQMPVMNGYEAAEKIRELGYEMPIIAITANALKGVKDKCLQAGMNDFMSKPIDVPAFINKVTFWLDDNNKADIETISIDSIEEHADAAEHTESESQKEEKLQLELNAQLKKDEQEVKEAMTSAAQIALSFAEESHNIDLTDELFSKTTTAYIDKNKAVAGMNGNKKLFLKLLAEFIEKEQNSSNEIAKLLSTDNLELARNKVHTIKGLVGSFGCEALRKISFVIQNEIDNGRTKNLHILLQRYDELLQQFIDSAQQIIREEQPTAKTQIQPLQSSEDQAKQKLEEYLEENNQLARDILGAMIKASKDETQINIMQQMVEAVSSFDFSKARELFQEL